MSCLSGTKHGDDDFAEGLELWEKAQPEIQNTTKNDDHA
jgi:hypothetical protein